MKYGEIVQLGRHRLMCGDTSELGNDVTEKFPLEKGGGYFLPKDKQKAPCFSYGDECLRV